ncbi:MAG TPA: hypothetical protein VIL46_15220 [Gemmataceae bacterium]
MNRELTAVEVSRARVPVDQARLLRRLRARQLSNAGWQMLGNSRLKLFTMVLCSLVVWGFVFSVSWWGFGFFAQKKIPFAGAIVGTLFDLMFFALGGMLVFSTGIILYASLFTAPESRFLLSTPAREDQVYAAKFQTAVGFSSWAFVVLGSPVLIGYGVVFGVPWYFYALLPVLLLGFVLLPGAVGAVITLLFVNYVPRKKKQFFFLVFLLFLALAGIWGYRTIVLTRASTGRDALETLVGQFALTQSALMPSHWMSRAVVLTARGDLADAMYPLALIWANGLFFYVGSAWLAGRLYRRGFNRLSTGSGRGRRYGTTWADRLVNLLVFYLDRQTRLLIVKDFKAFRRDPSQWVQIGIFAGLILLYCLNSRQFYQQDVGRAFQSGISLLNLAATSFLLCAYLVRFVYPLLSLEGRKFWILGLLPLSRERLLWGKFVFAFTGAAVIGVVMVALSDVILGMPALAVGVHLLTIVVVALGLSGLSVGIGAWIPNFRETDPSKIVAGFGGTMNTIVCLFYLLLTIGLMAGPYHIYRAGESLSAGGPPWWVYAGVAAGVIPGALAVAIPMRLGTRTLRRMEF